MRKNQKEFPATIFRGIEIKQIIPKNPTNSNESKKNRRAIFF